MNRPSMHIPSVHTGVCVALDHDLAEDLHWAIGLVEDWLLHASPEALDELADFAYGPTRRDHDSPDQPRWLINLLGEAAVRLRPAPQPPNQPPTAERRPSR